MKFSESEKAAALKTYRGGSWSINAIVPRIVERYTRNIIPLSILDYGCGKGQVHVQKLKSLGRNVYGYDFALDNYPNNKKFNIVYASNVLNVQISEDMLRKTLEEICSLVIQYGFVFVNYPSSPRKTNISNSEMESILDEYFDDVIKESSSRRDGVVWICKAR